jgi:trehalose 6-phosphate synthase
MNLVAKEGPAVNEADGVLILSKNAGAWYELGHAAIDVNPFDIDETAEALYHALTMDPTERSYRAAILKDVVDHNTPAKWVRHQLEDIAELTGRRTSKQGSQQLR